MVYNLKNVTRKRQLIIAYTFLKGKLIRLLSLFQSFSRYVFHKEDGQLWIKEQVHVQIIRDKVMQGVTDLCHSSQTLVK